MSIENQLINVQTWVESGLGELLVNCPVLDPANGITNLDLSNFNKLPAQLGDTVLGTVPSRFRNQNSLVITKTGVVQKQFPLSVTNVLSNNITSNASNHVFNNMKNWVESQKSSRLSEVGIELETRLNTQFDSAYVVANDQNPNDGEIQDITSGPYRFFANGWALNSNVIPAYNTYVQLIRALALYRNFGFVDSNTVFILPDLVVPNIIDGGFSNFTPDRGNQTSKTWKIPVQAQCNFFASSLLPTHLSGSVGNSNSFLTLVSVVQNNGIITELTFSGAAANDPNAIKRGDLIQFATTNGFTFIRPWGHNTTDTPVQVKAISDVASNGAGEVTIPIYPALNFNSIDPEQNIPFNPPVGTTLAGIPPDHVCGIIMSGSPFYFAAPSLPAQPPYPTGVVTHDKYPSVSMRYYNGWQLGQDTGIDIFDMIYGSYLHGDYCQQIMFPLNPAGY